MLIETFSLGTKLNDLEQEVNALVRRVEDDQLQPNENPVFTGLYSEEEMNLFFAQGVVSYETYISANIQESERGRAVMYMWNWRLEKLQELLNQ